MLLSSVVTGNDPLVDSLMKRSVVIMELTISDLVGAFDCDVISADES